MPLTKPTPRAGPAGMTAHDLMNSRSENTPATIPTEASSGELIFRPLASPRLARPPGDAVGQLTLRRALRTARHSSSTTPPCPRPRGRPSTPRCSGCAGKTSISTARNSKSSRHSSVRASRAAAGSADISAIQGGTDEVDPIRTGDPGNGLASAGHSRVSGRPARGSPMARPGQYCLCRPPVRRPVRLPGLFSRGSVSLARKENSEESEEEHSEKNAQALPDRCTSRHDSPAY